MSFRSFLLRLLDLLFRFLLGGFGLLWRGPLGLDWLLLRLRGGLFLGGLLLRARRFFLGLPVRGLGPFLLLGWFRLLRLLIGLLDLSRLCRLRLRRRETFHPDLLFALVVPGPGRPSGHSSQDD